MQHASGIQQGENLYAGSGREYTFSDAVGAWVGEKTKYSGQSIPDGDFSSYGHYTQVSSTRNIRGDSQATEKTWNKGSQLTSTQVIWPETTQVGMASAKGSNGWTYIVGRYLSPGNVSGQSAYRAGPTGPSAPPSSETQGGYYLVNSYKDGQASSGAAWYNHLGGNDGQRPQMYVNIKTDGVLTWEGNTHRGLLAPLPSLSFPLASWAEYIVITVIHSNVSGRNDDHG